MSDDDLAKLTFEQRAALEVLLRRERAAFPGAGAGGPVPPRPDPAVRPLSFAQQRLWFLDQLAPGDPAYNIPGALRLIGPLQAAVLARSFAAIAARHEVLRARFTAVEGRPEQIVEPPAGCPLPVVDLGELPAEMREPETLRLADAEARRPFDLARGPLLRATLVRSSAEESMALVTLHHIAADGWSVGIILRELSALYGAGLGGRQAPAAALPPLAIQYADFAAWQRAWLSGPRLETAVAHWREALAGMPDLDLPGDLGELGEPEEGSRGGAVPVFVPAGLADRMREVSRAAGASLFMTLLAAFQLLLSRWSGQRDFGVGTPVANRTRPEIEGLVGFFVNTLVLRADLGGDPTFLELLRRVRETALDAFAHQELPFEKLVEELQPERRSGRNPLFSVLLALQNAPARPASFAGVAASLLPVHNRAVRFDLALDWREKEGGLAGTLEHRSSLFTAPAARRMTEHLRNLISAVASCPSCPISEIPMLGGAERHQILVEWGGFIPAEPGWAPFPDQVAAQAARTPQAPAVVFAGVTLSYHDLEQRAGRVARALLGRGIGPGSRVVLFFERSPDQVTALLGIMKAGGAPVPLEPGAPPDRLAFLLADCAPGAVLTTAGLLGRLPPAAPILLFEEALAAGGAEAGWRSLPALEPGHLAYVIYTSGSTGRPKGTLVHHGALALFARGLREAVEELRAGRPLRLGLNASLSFDASFQLIVQLAAGHTLRILPEEARRDPDPLAALLAATPLDGFDGTPSQLEMLLAAIEASGQAPGFVLVGGEPIPPVLWERLAAHPHVRFYNVYGPTEITVEATSARVAGRRPLVGTPIPGYQIRVADGDGLPVPLGVRGEVQISGPAVAQGYWRRPELTADRFRPDPFAGMPGQRLYHTGDVGRWQAEGSLELLGRLDDQVKIRGLRIEPGEVEAALAAHPEVRSAVVLPRRVASGGMCLIAWIVPASGSVGPAAGELRGFLRGRLPEAMLPAAFVPLRALPLSSRGKLDRSALPEPEPSAETVAGPLPRDPAEELMASLFAQVLGREAVGIDESFFHLGGHSLLATRLVSRIRAAFAVELPVRSLFDHPTPAQLAAAVRELDGVPPAPPVVRREPGGPVPLSFAQQRLWMLHQLSPGLTAYHLPAALRLRGPLNVPALGAALSAVVDRHEALRTSFPARGGEPVQEIAPPAPVPVPEIDLSALPEGARDAAAHRLAGEEARCLFDLEHGPLFRARRLRLGAGDNVLLLTVHHLVSDGWSTAVFFRELSVLYVERAGGESAALPPLPVQYADYAVWQRQWLRGAVLDAQLSDWMERLAGAPRVLNLPTDHPRPPVESQAGATVPVSLPPAAVEGVRRLAREAGATLYMTLLAGFQALLGRSAGADRISVGSPVAGRNRVEIEGLIGFFVNTLVIHTDLGGAPSVRGLIARVREAVLGAFSRQDLPFEKLVEALNPDRDLRWSPLVQAMFTLDNLPQEKLSLPGIAVSPFEVSFEPTQFDLSLSLRETGGGISGALRYRTALFRDSTVRRLAGHFATLLAGMAAAPESSGRSLAELPILTEAERHQLLVEWRGPERPLPAQSLAELFMEQAARSPAAVAVVCEGDAMTYGELDRRSSRLAYALRRLGAGPEGAVAISVQRSLEMAVGLLGILKSGAAYLPIDPRNPRERQAFMLEDCGAQLLLTQERWAEGLRRPGLTVLCLDSGWEALAGEPDTPPPPRGGPANAIAFLYTSGSTGRPKATVIEARGFLNLCLWFRDVCPITEETRALLGFAFSFDAAFKNVLVPWLAGGRTVLANPGLFDPAEMLAALRAERVTFLNTTPSQMVSILEAAAVDGWEGLEPLQTLILGGEAADWWSLRGWLESGRCQAMPMNMYGPSEGSDTVSSYRASLDEVLRDRRLPVGRAADNLRITVVDDALQALPIGVPGEVCLGGVGLARGYFARPDLTAERFIPDPGVRGDRMYRTGDLGRWRADGNLEIVGRLDDQVKIRGVRVEPAEVEAALVAHPAIRRAVVLARRRGDGETRLVAWLVPVEGAEIPPGGALRDFLRRRLTETMLPQAFVVLAALPLNARGKVDRAALPEPRGEGAGTAVGFHDPAAELMAALWAEVLELQKVGLHDDFFRLGGHSLLATRLVSRIRSAFGVEVPVRLLFAHPTVAGLTVAVRGLGRSAPPLPAVRRVPRDGLPLPVSLAQRRLWVFHQLFPGTTAYHLAAGFRLHGPLEATALTEAFSALSGRHESLRSRFPAGGGEPLQAVDPPGPVPLPLLDLSALPAAARDEEARRIAAAEARRLFDLAAGPLLRCALFRSAPEEHALLVTLHHLVCDAWSLAIFVRELAAFHDAALRGERAFLADLPVQYGDYAVWQHEQLGSGALEDQLRWWRERLGDSPGVLDLPTDHPRPEAVPEAGASLPVRVPADLLERLRELARAQGVTLYMVLLAGFQALLGRWSGEEAVSVGTYVAGRNRLEIEGLIGFFVNTLVIRTDLRGSPAAPALLARVREAVLGAFAHQDLPFERLVEALNPERDAGWTPLFQAGFALQNVPREEPRLHGLAVTPFPVDAGAVQLNLSLTLEETAQGIAGEMRYRIALFNAATLERLAWRYTALLGALAGEPSRPVWDLPVLSEMERRQAAGPLRGRRRPGAGLPGGQASCDETEERLLALFREVLGVESLEISDGFFDLGGHSLSAVHLLARVREMFGRSISIAQFFRSPTVAGIASLLRLPTTGPRRPASGAGALPLSFAQQRLWVVDRLAPGNATYNMPAGLRLRGPLDVPALADGLSEILRRHGTLRTRFEIRGDQPVQVVEPAAPLALPVVDLAALPATALSVEEERAAREEAATPFDLGRPPLLRARLLRLSSAEHRLLLTVHHIAADAWSLGVAVGELTAFYAAFAAGRPSPLLDPSSAYTEFAAEQRETYRGETLAEEVSFWRRRLAGAKPLDLPTDRTRPPVPSFHGASWTGSVESRVLDRLYGLAQRRRATPFMVFAAPFMALAGRLAGTMDVVVGTTVAGRERPGLEDLIGFFVNPLVLRADLGGDSGGGALLDRVRQTVLDAFAHQGLPFDLLVEELGLPRDPHRPPLLRVMIQLLDMPALTPALPGLILEEAGSPGETAKLDLVLNLREGPDGLRAVWVYDTDLFDATTVERIAESFALLTEAWVEDPGRPIRDLPLLRAAQRHQIVVEANQGLAGPLPERRCLHRRFEEWALRTPEAAAVAFEGMSLSYREVNERADRLTRFLVASGVVPGDFVALWFERSPAMIVAVLATLKAGAGYVPIDPDSPPERAAFALADSGARLLLAGDGVPEPAMPSGVRVVRTASVDDSPGGSSPARLPEVDPDFAAYVIYTSGSTGRPKGVVITHADVDRLLAATAEWFRFGPQDVWTLFHSYAFDFSVWEMWGALAWGGRLVVVPYWVSRSPVDFYRLLARERVTVLNQTPSAFRQLAWTEGSDLGGAALLPPALSLRLVIFGGEALELGAVRRWVDRHGLARPALVNMYGITETTVHVTGRFLAAEDLAAGNRIGRPIPDMTLHVLDGGFDPQPLGVPGEIAVGGAGLAWGYLGRPEWTAERFVPDPFSAAPGARLYRSGDLARRRPDGGVETLGRIDHQVKIRGFRVEPGEIEAAFAAYPGVRQAVVVACDSGAGEPEGERRLMAYVVPGAEGEEGLAGLRGHLEARLPGPMIPGTVVVLASLPLTANGKIDRGALPMPGAVPRRDLTAPRGDLERFLARQFREVLGIAEEIGVDDDFFALGGSSISAAILVNRVQEALGEIVHVVAIFDHPTVAALGAYVAAEHPSPAQRLWGEAALEGNQAEAPVGPIEVQELREVVAARRPSEASAREEPRNPPAVFVLSPPRSGSTLLRVMLGAHPALFAPPELELLSFFSMAERRSAFQGRDSFWLEGAIRAVMEARGCEAVEAELILEEIEAAGWTTRRFYRELQSWIAPRMLVDKTPSYALDPQALQQAEADFEGARYLHLVRHPQAARRSFEEAKLDQVFFHRPLRFNRRQVAELVWTVSHQNILGFLAGIPKSRRHTVHFEDLVREPERVLAGICSFLGLPYHPDMAMPYRQGVARMIDGPHAESRMLGDVKFLGHSKVDPAAAERWRRTRPLPLGEPAREVAEALGYAIDPAGFPERGPLVPIQTGSPERLPLYCVHPVGGEVGAYVELAHRLGADQPVYGLQAPDPPDGPLIDLREMAAVYLQAVRRIQPAGPYRLAGWSLGAAIAYEMACQLLGQGERVELLALIDAAAPARMAAAAGLTPGEDPAGEEDLEVRFARDQAGLLGLAGLPDDLNGLGTEGVLERVLEAGRAAGVFPAGSELRDVRRLCERFAANRRALASYAPRPYAGDALLLRASERAQRAEREDDPALGWGELVAGKVRIVEVPGDHYSILRGAGVERLAEELVEPSPSFPSVRRG